MFWVPPDCRTWMFWLDCGGGVPIDGLALPTGAAATELTGRLVVVGAASTASELLVPLTRTAPARRDGCPGSPAWTMAITPTAVSIAHAAVRPRAGASRGDTGGSCHENRSRDGYVCQDNHCLDAVPLSGTT